MKSVPWRNFAVKFSVGKIFTAKFPSETFFRGVVIPGNRLSDASLKCLLCLKALLFFSCDVDL